jgi:hypothetical protein
MIDSQLRDPGQVVVDRAPMQRKGPAMLERAGLLVRRHMLLVSAVALWILAMAEVDPEAMGDLGLLSVLPITGYLALIALTVSFFRAMREGRRVLELAIHVIVLVFLLHGSLALVYGTVRYSWAWKHIGIVDFVQRTGMVQPDIAVLDVYHNWPSFFGLGALLTELAGFESAASFAAWAPLVFNLLYVGALVVILRSLASDHRVVWTATWIFAVTNWVGQDYFAPQAFAFFLYLTAVGTMLQWFSRRPPRLLRAMTERLRLGLLQGSKVLRLEQRHGTMRGIDPATIDDDEVGVSEAAHTRLLLSIVFVILGAIITSHPLTPLMLTVSMASLSILGVSSSRWFPVAVAALTAGWMFTGARTFLSRQFTDTVEQTGSVGSNLAETFLDLSRASFGQVVVAWVGRGLVVLVMLLAVVGAVRWLQSSMLDLRPLVLLAAPLTLVVGGSYDGEAIFRVYLFALPPASLLGAYAFYPTPHSGRDRRTTIAAIGVCVALLGGFMFAYFGKEQQYYFTTDEVNASATLFSSAAPGSLIVEGSRNYPSQFINYEQFVYVPISREPTATHARIAADPVGVMEEWLSNDAYPEAYLIITRSQKAEIDGTGVMPPGLLTRVETALMSSPLFHPMIHTPNVSVFQLVERRG